MFKLSKWLSKSYRGAIEANIRRTRSSDLSIPARAASDDPGASTTFRLSLWAWAIMS